MGVWMEGWMVGECKVGGSEGDKRGERDGVMNETPCLQESFTFFDMEAELGYTQQLFGYSETSRAGTYTEITLIIKQMRQ